MELVDTHCHLQFDNYDDPGRVIANAQAVGVNKFICVGTTYADSQKTIGLAAAHSQVWASVGIHPHEAKKFLSQTGNVGKLKELAAEPKVVAVGEIGLDFYKNYSPRKHQKEALRYQIEVGLASNLPFIFHVRDAWEDFWQVFDSFKNLRGVIHSFSAHPQQLNEALSRGLYIGLNGIMTFTTDSQQLAAAKQVPAAKLLLETDAPFLAPKPFRGKTCEPKHVIAVADFLADLRGEPVAQLAAITTKNAVNLFNLKNS